MIIMILLCLTVHSQLWTVLSKVERGQGLFHNFFNENSFGQENLVILLLFLNFVKICLRKLKNTYK